MMQPNPDFSFDKDLRIFHSDAITGRCSVGQLGHGPPNNLAGWAIMVLALPIITSFT